jgi:hypothetical protein
MSHIINIKEIPAVLRRARLENSVIDRKKAQLRQQNFQNARLADIDKCLDEIRTSPEKISELKREIFILIFSPPLISNSNLADDVRNHHHIISDSINIDLGIWKLVNTGQWEVLKQVHKSAIEEFCPEIFRDKLYILWD